LLRCEIKDIELSNLSNDELYKELETNDKLYKCLLDHRKNNSFMCHFFDSYYYEYDLKNTSEYVSKIIKHHFSDKKFLEERQKFLYSGIEDLEENIDKKYFKSYDKYVDNCQNNPYEKTLSFKDWYKAFHNKKSKKRYNKPPRKYTENLKMVMSLIYNYVSYIASLSKQSYENQGVRLKDDSINEDYSAYPTINFYKKGTMYSKTFNRSNSDIYVTKYDDLHYDHLHHILRTLEDKIRLSFNKKVHITRTMILDSFLLLSEANLGTIKVGERLIKSGVEKEEYSYSDLFRNEITKFIPKNLNQWFGNNIEEIEDFGKKYDLNMHNVILDLHLIRRTDKLPYLNNGYKEIKRYFKINDNCYIINKSVLSNKQSPNLIHDKSKVKKNQNFKIERCSQDTIYENQALRRLVIDRVTDEKKQDLLMPTRIYTDNEDYGGRFTSLFNRMGKVHRNYLMYIEDMVELDFSASIFNILYMFTTGKKFNSKNKDKNIKNDFYNESVIYYLEKKNIELNEKNIKFYRKHFKMLAMFFIGNNTLLKVYQSIKSYLRKNKEVFDIKDYDLIIDSFYKSYPDISIYFGVELHGFLFNIESTVCKRMMERLLLDRRMPYAVHDAFYVSKATVQKYTQYMEKFLLEEVIKNKKRFAKFFLAKSSLVNTSYFLKSLLPKFKKIYNLLMKYFTTNDSAYIDKLYSKYSNPIKLIGFTNFEIIHLLYKQGLIDNNYFLGISLDILKGLVDKDTNLLIDNISKISYLIEHDSSICKFKDLGYFNNNINYLVKDLFDIQLDTDELKKFSEFYSTESFRSRDDLFMILQGSLSHVIDNDPTNLKKLLNDSHNFKQFIKNHTILEFNYKKFIITLINVYNIINSQRHIYKIPLIQSIGYTLFKNSE
jgi:hypothetical protein